MFAYVFWSGSRQVRLRNQAAKRTLQNDENNAANRESHSGLEDDDDDLYGVHPLDVHDDLNNRNPQHDSMMLQRLEARKERTGPGSGGTAQGAQRDRHHSNTPGSGRGNHNVFLRPRVFAPEVGDDDYDEGGQEREQGREYYDDDAIEEEEIILI